MKFSLLTLILIALSLCGCSNTSIKFPNELDVPDKGYYTVFYITDLSGTSKNDLNDDMLPVFLKSEPPHKMSTLELAELKDFNESYGEHFNISKTPYYIFLDSEKNIFQTSDLNKAEEFFSENIINE